MTSSNGHMPKPGMYAEMLLPHDIEAEEAVIGSILIDGDCVSQVSAILRPQDFYRERNTICFEAALTLHEAAVPVDQITLARELQKRQKLENAGGMAYLSHLVSVTPTSTHVEWYARQVIDAASKRNLIDTANRICALGYSETTTAQDAIGQSQNLLLDLDRQVNPRSWVWIHEVYDDLLQQQADVLNPESAGQPPILTGYYDLDELLGGIYAPNSVVIGARPGTGKSALAMNIATHAARDGHSVGVFSLEMSRHELASRLLARDADVEAMRLRNGLYTEAEEQRIIASIGDLSELRICIDDTPHQTIRQIAATARQIKREASLDLLIIDYLQLIQGTSAGAHRNSENRVQEISEISRRIKTLAQELQVPIITCSQLNRAVESRPDHRPRLADLRDSGAIEQDADTVMFIYRQAAYYSEEEWEDAFPDLPYPRDEAEIIVAKHRIGYTGSVNLRFQGRTISFENHAYERRLV